jgi:hypothetical protein
MRRKRLSLAKRRHRQLRRFAGAPLRRFLAKCRSSYHFSIWHSIKRRARLTGETGCSVRKRPGMGRETCGERSDVRSWRCCHHLRLLAVTHYRRREVEGGPPSIDARFRKRCQCRVLVWLGRPRPPPEPTAPHGSCGGYFSIRAAAFEPRIKHYGRIR